ncbi:ABC transporter ATP-binding protein [Pseudonocardia sp. CA-142604]|uniref:ABC transporter ATP-binding protein n=1 Tax=Pseudonocardia sp. CA-142604 TaxID=3240024 RepID=UPI003D8A48F3
MLHADDLWFRYDTRLPWIVRGVSLRIEDGEVVGLRGPSGTGKSTLGRLLAGFAQPDRGSVTVDGAPARPDDHARRAHPVQLVLQHPERAVNPRWTVREILAETGASRTDIDGLDHALVAPQWLDRFPHEISGGELQRVNLARALLARPRFIIADEISASLDAVTQARIWHLLLAETRSAGIGVLAISHDRPLLDVVADRTLEWADLSTTGTQELTTQEPSR